MWDPSCCSGNDRETCGLIYKSCCQRGYCRGIGAGSYCPDDHQIKCWFVYTSLL